VAPVDDFDWDLRAFGGDLSFRLPTETLEDTGEHVIWRDANGTLWKRTKRTSVMNLMDFTITTPELIKPAHKLVCDVFKGRGKAMLLHSDGNVGALIPQFLEIGIDARTMAGTCTRSATGRLSS
jgi:hypothetical protein